MSIFEKFLSEEEDQTPYFVLDLETTGKKGYPHDFPIEIAIYEVDPKSKQIDEIYHEYIYEQDKLAQYYSSWIVTENKIYMEEIEMGKSLNKVAAEVQELLNEQKVTSYNIEFDFDKFLFHPPFSLDVKLLPCLMISSMNYMKTTYDRDGSPRFPALYEAKRALTEDLDIENRPHKAIYDAYVAAHISLQLLEYGPFHLSTIQEDKSLEKITQDGLILNDVVHIIQDDPNFCESCDMILQDKAEFKDRVTGYCLDCRQWKIILKKEDEYRDRIKPIPTKSSVSNQTSSFSQILVFVRSATASWDTPSEESEEYWLYARRNSGSYPDKEVTDYQYSGKWLIFVERDEIDEYWNIIKLATEQGVLGNSSKVSTRKDHPHRTGKKTHVICVYTYDWRDFADVDKMRKTLKKLGITWRIPYKTDQATREEKYWVLGDKKISKYYF